MAYKYGKTFKKNGKLVRYRYTNGKKSTKKLVAVSKKKVNRRRKKWNVWYANVVDHVRLTHLC